MKQFSKTIDNQPSEFFHFSATLDINLDVEALHITVNFYEKSKSISKLSIALTCNKNKSVRVCFLEHLYVCLCSEYSTTGVTPNY